MEDVKDCLLDVENIFEKNKVFESDLLKLVEYSKHQDEEVRLRVAEALGIFQNDVARTTLISLLEDEDELVRVEACDSLFFCKDIETFELLFHRFKNDKSPLVKKYAVLSMYDIAKNNIDAQVRLKKLLEANFEQELDEGVKISCYKGLYMLGEDRYLKMIIKELFNKDYRIRCAAINTLDELVSDSNCEEIYNSILMMKKNERTIAVRSSINRLLCENERLQIRHRA